MSDILASSTRLQIYTRKAIPNVVLLSSHFEGVEKFVRNKWISVILKNMVKEKEVSSKEDGPE
ncbi:hypothetical protein V1478_005425 [Vespula squamosa]|uniref:Uncharacterized protein n=1 Tax=Vespula squamosa TaxID=30214 RepID=A0ABD2BE48_VESSQ